MDPLVFCWGLGSFLAAWCLHAAWWRMARPRDDLKWLAVLLFCSSFVITTWALHADWLDARSSGFALLLSLALGAAYLFWYPAAQAASPTMLITLLAKRAGSDGLTEESLRESVSEQALAGESIENLFHERFAFCDAEGRVRLAPRGKRTLRLIRLLRAGAGFADPKG